MDIRLDKVVIKIEATEKILFEVDHLHIPKGSTLLIKGASGKGKTTFLHLLAGLFTAQQGHVIIGDSNLSKMSDEHRALFRRQHMGLVFQKLNLLDHLTTLENIELSSHGQFSKAQARQALNAVGLSDKENSKTSVLSLGEQQRVAIARVLAGPADIILADEPTSSLDEANAHEVIKLLIQSSQEKTLIVVSHDHRIEKYFSEIKNFEDFIK